MPTNTKGVALEHGLQTWAEQNNFTTKIIAVAVSGGADSMALALAFAKCHPKKMVHCFTVDHGLRHGSAAEARWTQRQVEAMGVACNVIRIPHIGSGNVQAAARIARYNALKIAAENAGASALCSAHTLDDQAETVLARLSRASGTKGLGAMANVAQIPGASSARSIQLHRPLLAIRRNALRTYLQQHDQRWAEDPSNANTQYDRIRLRGLVALWEASGFQVERIAAVAENMRRSDAALDYYAAVMFAAIVESELEGSLVFNRTAFLQYPTDSQLRFLSNCLQKVSQDDRSVRLAKLQPALERLQFETDTRFTLHGCIVHASGEAVKCVRED